MISHNKVKMVHMDTKEEIEVELGLTSWVSRKVIQDHEVIGYRIDNWTETMKILKSLDTVKVREDVNDDE